jgi:uncharacterized protein with gpF-like domain
MAITVDIAESEIRNAIAVAIAESFSSDKRDSLLRDIIRAHMQYKENSYDKETLLSKKIGNLVREIASAAVIARMEELRPEINAVVREKLDDRFAESIYTKLRTAISGKVIADISMVVRWDE